MLADKIFSDVIHFMKYAKYLPDLKRRETFKETCIRNMEMHIKRFPFLSHEIEDIYEKYVFTKTILPSMRSMQFAGEAITQNNCRMYNCSFAPIDHYKVFSEAMFLLLSGVGFGYSVQFHDVLKLPKIIKPRGTKTYIIQDNIAGWADSVNILIRSFFGIGKKPKFVYKKIRDKGMRLVTSGGKAPGHEPLKACLENIEKLLTNILKQRGVTSLEPVECHSILCYIADAVLAGGIRRAAMISLFSFEDRVMRTCKTGNWYEANPHFARANNSAVAEYGKVTKKMFDEFWLDLQNAGSGEPGISWTNNKYMGFNPCHEAALRPFSFCNLVEINAQKIESQEHFNLVCAAAAKINTLQASYTNLPYLRKIWQQTTEEDALIGVGITGIASGKLDQIDLKQGAIIVKETNKQFAALIGINNAARTTLIKPAGTSSIILATSSGMKLYESEWFLRRARVNKNESIYLYLHSKLKALIEDCVFNPDRDAVITFPQKSPVTATFERNADALYMFECAKKYNMEWIRPGHDRGDNYHNVSATVGLNDHEWDSAREWLWNNRHTYHGLTVFPKDNNTYKQLPFEGCSEEEFNKLYAMLKEVDLTEIVEEDDHTNLNDQVACSGNSCEIVRI